MREIGRRTLLTLMFALVAAFLSYLVIERASQPPPAIGAIAARQVADTPAAASGVASAAVSTPSDLMSVSDAIERFRKGPAVVTVTDPAGKACPGAIVTIEQVSHEFAFGFGLPDLEILKEHYSSDQLQKLYSMWDSLFNAATPQNVFKFSSIQPARGRFAFERADAAARWCIEHEIRMKIHTFIWQDNGQGQPGWLFECSGDELEGVFKEHIGAILSRYKDMKLADGRYLVYAADVVNEPVHVKAPLPLPPDFFRRIWTFCRESAARGGEPIELLVNEWDVVSASQILVFGTVAPQFGKFLDDLAAVDCVVGFQSHTERVEYSREQITDALDMLARHGVAKAHVTELMYPSDGSDVESVDYWRRFEEARKKEASPPAKDRWTEDYQAKALADMYRFCFADPRIEAITLWDTLDEPSWRPEMKEGLMRADLTPKPSWHALDRLLNSEWKTKLTLRADAKGEVPFRGFFGEYRIVCGDKSVSFRLAGNGSPVGMR